MPPSSLVAWAISARASSRRPTFAGKPERLHHRGYRVRFSAADDDGGAGAAKLKRDGAPDAASCTGNDGDAPAQIES